MLGRNPQSSKNGFGSLVCSGDPATQGRSIGKSDGFENASYAKVRDADFTLMWIASGWRDHLRTPDLQAVFRRSRESGSPYAKNSPQRRHCPGGDHAAYATRAGIP